jgi:Protein of unknown function (DUF3109)
MIVIDDIVLSDELVQEHFVCDLQQCKGGCCVDGDCGAPLTGEEVQILADIYPVIKPYLSAAYIPEIERQGTHTVDDEFSYVTPTVGDGICVYGYYDDAGIVKCGIEKAWMAGAINFRKPISCHLYPIRILDQDGHESVNYDPRPQLCAPACKLCDKLKIPVYRFVKDALIRKYGEEFYEALETVAETMKSENID